jgi:hypothetical protein
MQFKSLQATKAAIVGVMMIFLADFASAKPVMDDDAMAQLQSHRQLWQSQQIANYQYTYVWHCFCPYPANTPFKVLVKNKLVASASNLQTNQPLEISELSPVKSIDQLFEVIERAIDRRAEQIDVKYDPQLGYPTSIAIDYLKLVADDEVGYSVKDLVVLE